MKSKMFVKQKVADIARWRSEFGKMEEARRQHGLHLTGMYRAAEPGTIIVTLDVENVEKAKEFASSEVLRQGRERAGAIGDADYWIAEEAID
jgi:hypothetical protein